MGDDLFATPGPDKQSCRAPKDSCLCCKDHSASESAGEDEPALDGPWSSSTRPVFVHLQPPESFGPETTFPSRSWELETGRWPVRSVPVLCLWEPANPGPPPQARGDRPLLFGGRAHSPRYPVADHNKGPVIRPGGRAAVPAHFTGELGELFPGGPQCSYQGTCVPDLGLGLSWRKETSEERPGKERRREHSPPLIAPRAGGPQGLQQWTRVLGVMGSQIMVRGDKVYVSSNPGPVSVEHVALAGRVGGTDFSNESVLSSFPYLQFSTALLYMSLLRVRKKCGTPWTMIETNGY